MSVSRRKFLKFLTAAGAGTAAATVGGKKALAQHKHYEGYPGAYGVLHDTTLCVGCRSCEAACNEVNKQPKPDVPFDDLTVLDKKRRTKTNVFTVVNKYEVPGYGPVFRKQQCHHCQEPACASACFVNAFTKTPEGAVIYNPNVCVGCRYCLLACPWSMPAYAYDSAFDPVVVRCTMCHPRLKKGLKPGCVEACPMEALTFGTREDLLKIARERIKKHPDRYIDHIYGENELGGTNWLFLSGVSFDDINLPMNVPHHAPSDLTGGALAVVPAVVGAWPVLLTGVYAINKRKEKIAAKEQKEAVAKAIAETEGKGDEKLKQELEKAQKRAEAETAKAVKKAVAEAEAKFKEEAKESV